MQPDLVNREVVAEHQVVAAGPQPLGHIAQLGVQLRHPADILGNVESTFLRLSVPLNPSG